MSAPYIMPGEVNSFVLYDPRLPYIGERVAHEWAQKQPNIPPGHNLLQNDYRRHLAQGAAIYLKLVVKRLVFAKPLPEKVSKSQESYGLTDQHLPELTELFLAELASFIARIAQEINGLAEAFSPQAAKVLQESNSK